MERIPHEVLELALEQAGRAPSVHNTQPWTWRPTVDGVDLVDDGERRLVATDPSGRDMVMSCGAVLESLRVTSAALGWSARVQHLPDPAATSLLARVCFEPHVVTDHDRTLVQALQERHTDRRELSSWEVPSQRVEHLSLIARERGAFVTALSERQAGQLDALMVRAARLQARDEDALEELLTWTADRDSLGVPASSRLTSTAQESASAGPPRFPAGTLQDSAVDRSPPEAVWLVLSTSSDDTLSWLRSGEALQAAWLWATVERMSLLPFSQPTEVESVRRTVQEDLLLDRTCPQIVLRLGWPQGVSGSPVPRTGRRKYSSPEAAPVLPLMEA